jgi:PAS domain S-box-containing protein
MIQEARVRLTVERAFEGRRASSYNLFIAATMFTIVANLVSYLFVLLYFRSYFNTRGQIAQRISFLNHARLNFFGALLSWTYYWGINTSTISYEPVYPLIELDRSRGHESHWIPPGIAWDSSAMHFNILSRGYYQNFTESVVSMAQDGDDLTKYVGALFTSDSLGVVFCSPDGRPAYEFWGNFRTVWSFMFMKESMMESTPNTAAWFSESEEMCILMSSVFHLTPDALNSLRSTVSAMSEDMAMEAERILKPLKFAFPIALFVITGAVFEIASCIYQREVGRFAALLLSLPKQDKRECVKAIRRDRDIDDMVAGQAVRARSVNMAAVFNIALVLDLVACTGVFYACLENVDWYNTHYWYMNNWILLATGRKSNIVEGTLASLYAVLVTNASTHNYRGAQYNYLDQARLLKRIQDAVDRMVGQNKDLLEGDGVRPSATGQSADVDRLTLEQQCETNQSDQSFHESYRCSSALQMVHVFLTLTLKVKINPEIYNSRVTEGEIAELIHLAEAHLLPLILEIDRLYISMSDRVEEQFISSHQMYLIIDVVILALALFVVIRFCWVVNSCYDVLLTLMRRVSPSHILAAQSLQWYLLNRSNSMEREGLTAEERIIHHSADGIVCMGPTGLIDLINPAVTSVLGFQPEQLLGQPLNSLLVPAQMDKISQQIKLMADHQSAPLFEGHVTCLTDDEQEVHCGISLIAMFDGDQVSAFVAILTDESQLLKQQQEAEALKKQSEQLLFQILPRGIVVRLNAGEKDISFTILSATISFIDIVKFSEYSSNLTPQDIMGNLSLIFSSFDEELAKHPQLLKIKLIGDVYMSAGGLFTPDSAPEAHAREMVHFALEALKIIDDVNVKLNSLLAVRIGVNTGGPILAGVLGTDKPAFDIIGDPINIAARLQSTDIPGQIQVSEDTYKLIHDMPAKIEYRGEIELKGKGKKRTYLVSLLADQSLLGTSTSAFEDFARYLPDSTTG